MLFTKLRRKCSYFRYRHFSYHGKTNVMVIALVFFLIILLIIIIFLNNVRPLLVQLTVAKATDIVTEATNKTIADKLADGSLDYDQLVSLEKDSDGNITALVTKMARINTLQAEITNGVIEELSDKQATVVDIPLGNVIGGTVLSGRGPNIPVKILSATSVSAEFQNEFSSAGINQTRHQIMLDVYVTIDIIVPGYETTETVNAEVAVAETIIVGKVPSTYADLYGRNDRTD